MPRFFAAALFLVASALASAPTRAVEAEGPWSSLLGKSVEELQNALPPGVQCTFSPVPVLKERFESMRYKEPERYNPSDVRYVVEGKLAFKYRDDQPHSSKPVSFEYLTLGEGILGGRCSSENPDSPPEKAAHPGLGGKAPFYRIAVVDNRIAAIRILYRYPYDKSLSRALQNEGTRHRYVTDLKLFPYTEIKRQLGTASYHAIDRDRSCDPCSLLVKRHGDGWRVAIFNERDLNKPQTTLDLDRLIYILPDLALKYHVAYDRAFTKAVARLDEEEAAAAPKEKKNDRTASGPSWPSFLGKSVRELQSALPPDVKCTFGKLPIVARYEKYSRERKPDEDDPFRVEKMMIGDDVAEFRIGTEYEFTSISKSGFGPGYKILDELPSINDEPSINKRTEILSITEGALGGRCSSGHADSAAKRNFPPRATGKAPYYSVAAINDRIAAIWITFYKQPRDAALHDAMLNDGKRYRFLSDDFKTEFELLRKISNESGKILLNKFRCLPCSAVVKSIGDADAWRIAAFDEKDRGWLRDPELTLTDIFYFHPGFSFQHQLAYDKALRQAWNMTQGESERAKALEEKKKALEEEKKNELNRTTINPADPKRY